MTVWLLLIWWKKYDNFIRESTLNAHTQNFHRVYESANAKNVAGEGRLGKVGVEPVTPEKELWFLCRLRQ